MTYLQAWLPIQHEPSLVEPEIKVIPKEGDLIRTVDGLELSLDIICLNADGVHMMYLCTNKPAQEFEVDPCTVEEVIFTSHL
jgi:hypothetical protein